MTRRLSQNEGFMLIELMVAIVVLTVGVLGTIGAFESSRALSLVSERQETMIHRARQEVERLTSLSYAQLAMTAAPAPSAVSGNPDNAVAAGPPATLTYGSSTETIVVDSGAGVVSPQPQSWSEGNDSGQIYDFVTWHPDTTCGTTCTTSQAYKRLVVAITQSSPHGPTKPIYLSTYLADPTAAPSGSGGSVSNGTQNPLQSPTTSCQNAQGQTVSCTNGLAGSAQTWFLSDTPGTQTSRQTITASHAVHPTVAPLTSLVCAVGISLAGCPVPDLLSTTPPTGDSTTPVYDYSTDLDSAGATVSPTLPGGATCASGQHCGRALNPDTTCSGTPTSTDNGKGAMWVSSPLGANLTLTGDGGLTLFTQTLGGVAATVGLCIEIYDVPGDMSNLLAKPATALGGASYQPGTYPTALQGLSFSFNFRGSLGSVGIPAGDRVGIRVWVSSTSQAGVGLLYDHPLFSSQLELNTT